MILNEMDLFDWVEQEQFVEQVIGNRVNQVHVHKLKQPVHYSYQKMSSQTKKRQNNFDLTDSQKDYLAKLLPKRYSFTPLYQAIQQKYDHDYDKMWEELNDQNINIMIGSQPSQQGKIATKKTDKKTSKQDLNNSQIISNRNSIVKTQQVDKSEQSQKLAKRKSALRQKKTKKIKEQIIKESESIKEIGKVAEVQSSIKNGKQQLSKQRFKEKQSESIRHSGSVQTFYQLSGAQKEFSLKVLRKLKSHKSSWPFRVAVDPSAQGVPDYLQIIKEPMDLRTIEKKINSNKYEHIAQFHADINRIFLNSYKFNPRDTNYFLLTLDLEDFYHQLLKIAESNPDILDKNKKGSVQEDIQQDFSDLDLKKKKSMQVNGSVQSDSAGHNLRAKKYTLSERKQFVRKVNQLNKKELDDMIDFIKNMQCHALEEAGDNFLIDFEKLNDECLDRLTKYFRNQENCPNLHMQHTNSHSNFQDMQRRNFYDF